MFLVLGEKPSVAQALAEVLGAKKREDGYLEGEDCIVSWCLGHLAEYAAPGKYMMKGIRNGSLQTFLFFQRHGSYGLPKIKKSSLMY